MEVLLLRYTPDPEFTVAMAARLCYSNSSVRQLQVALPPEEVVRLVRMLYQMGHLSPFEHVSFTFGISGVSRALSHQLVRHRIASYSQKSQRWTSEQKFEYVVPPSVLRNAQAKELFERQMRSIHESYARLVELGIPKEDARYVLPNACHTQLVATFNARSLLNFFKLRCCSRAQWEIRVLAYKMLKLVKQVAPTLFENAGPPCVCEGVCREGRLSCGRIERLKKRNND
ncbi:MAG: FAD-dependent thymidylate synthase [Bacillota bacterium]